MSRRRESDLYVRKLLEAKGEGDRYVDYYTEFYHSDEKDNPGKFLFSCGGVWDRKAKSWSDVEPKTKLTLKVHSGQLGPTKFWEDWLTRYCEGKPNLTYDWLNIGGTGAGKTYLGIRCPIVFAATIPDVKVWIVVETENAFYECMNELDTIIPASWALKSGNEYKFYNGSSIAMFSGRTAKKLKKGDCHLAFFNEGQNMTDSAFNMVKMRVARKGGITIVAANPPDDDNENGEWIAAWTEDNATGRIKNTRVDHYDPFKNPFISREQLGAMQNRMSKRQYDIEVLGLILPPSNSVFHAFSAIDNVAEYNPRHDITEAFCESKGYGTGIKYIAGLDFQRVPFQAAAIMKVVGTLKNPQPFFLKGILVELGDEHDLSAALYDYGCKAKDTLLIGDASGEWQDADRTKGGSSFGILKKCGWPRLVPPEAKSKRNPRIDERFKNTNRICQLASGERNLFVSPEARDIIRCFKAYRRKNGRVDRHAKQAHLADAITYPLWRLFPPKHGSDKFEYKSLKKRTRKKSMANY